MDWSQKWFQLFGRLALGAIFLVSAAGKLTNWSATVAYAAARGVPQILLAGSTTLELVGVVLLLAGYKTRWGAAALVVFLVPVTWVFHGFWAVQGAEQQQQLVEFLKNLAITGGLVVEFVAGPGALSLDGRLAEARLARAGRTDRSRASLVQLGLCCLLATAVSACSSDDGNGPEQAAAGKEIFRYDTFGDETKWTDALRLNEALKTVDPTTALAVGLKVDSEALPLAVVAGIQDGTISLTDPATTVALLKLNAVLGVKGTVETINGKDTLTRVGLTCALCHSTVDNSFAPGIGKRLDGWPAVDLNVGAIIALSPALDAAAKAIFNSWGPGKYDPRFNQDGKNGPQVIPPAYGLNGLHRITSTGDGDAIAYWNRYVGVTQLGGHGSFSDSRIGVNVTNGTDDLISSKLPALQAYQLTLSAPAAPPASFDPAAAARGQALFAGKGSCQTCHSGPDFTDANTRLHPPSDSMGEPEAPGVPSWASRSATKQYRTAPLKGVWQHAPYFHNGSAASLDDVVAIYNTRRSLGLTSQERADLVQYLKSL